MAVKRTWWVLVLAVLGGLGFGFRAPAAAAPTAARAPALAMEVDVSERKLYVRKDGEVLRTYRVAVGRPGNPTPRGKFRVQRIIWNPSWRPPDAAWAKEKKARAPGDPKNPMGRVKMFFQDPDYYIHGTHDVDSLGRAESRGCIRMRNADVIALAKLVMQHGGAKRDEGWFRRVLNRVRSSQEVRLSQPIPFTIKS